MDMLPFAKPSHRSIRASDPAVFFLKLITLLALISITSACEIFISKSEISPPTNDNPSVNGNLGTSFPAARPVEDNEDTNNIALVLSPSTNQLRLTVAQKQTQDCELVNQPCLAIDDGRIEYTYSATGFLESATEFELGVLSDEVTHRQYYYSLDNPNRLDKSAVSESSSGNFHTIHDYTYDDEDDPSDREADITDALDNNTNNDNDGYNANIGLVTPRLRKEYICDNLDIADPSLAICNRDNATEVVNYIYNVSGTLHRKEFDFDNDTLIEQQKLYFYIDNILTKVERDDFYNTVVDARTTYLRSQSDGLIVEVNKDALSGDSVDTVISYRINTNNDNEIIRECYFKKGFPEDEDGDLITECSASTDQDYHWSFEWQVGPCWAGGIDDIDPETRAIDYLCKQPSSQSD